MRTIWIAILLTALAVPGYADVFVQQVNGSLVKKTGFKTTMLAADTVGKTVVVTGSETVTGTVTVPSGVAVRVENGGKFVKGTGGKIAFNGPFQAGLYQVFSGFAAGDITGLKSPKLEWWGGVPDGTTNCAPAWQCAVASGATLLELEQGQYKITTALNITNRVASPLIIRGVGAHVDSNGYSSGTTILCNTGSWIADFTGSQFITIQDVHFKATGTGASTMGILFARSNTVPYAMYVNLQRVIVTLPSSIGSSVGSVALYCSAAENMVVDHCWFESDSPYVHTLANDLSIASPYATISTSIVSAVDISHRQNVFRARTYSGMFLYGVASTTFDQCYWDKYDGTNTYPYGISFRSSASGYQNCQNIKLTGQVESFASVAILEGSTKNIHFNLGVSNVTADYVVAAAGSSQTGLNINMMPYSGGNNILKSTAGTVNIYGGRLTVQQGSKLTDGFVKLIGTDVDILAADSRDAAIFTVSSDSAYRLISATTHLRGAVTWGSPGAISNGASVSTTVTVAGAEIGDFVQASFGASLQGCSLAAFVSATNTVTVTITNNTGSSKTIGSATAKVVVTQ